MRCIRSICSRALNDCRPSRNGASIGRSAFTGLRRDRKDATGCWAWRSFCTTSGPQVSRSRVDNHIAVINILIANAETCDSPDPSTTHIFQSTHNPHIVRTTSLPVEQPRMAAPPGGSLSFSILGKYQNTNRHEVATEKKTKHVSGRQCIFFLFRYHSYLDVE